MGFIQATFKSVLVFDEVFKIKNEIMLNLLKIIKVSLLIIFLFSFNFTQAQLQITPNQTANQLVNILVGGGLSFSNATYSGATNSNGKFTTGGTPTNLGMSSGIILSSGSVLDAPGPNASGSITTSNGTGSDPQLAGLIPGYTINDACYLQFSFVPESDTIKFRYVFGSDEYPEWVSSSYNDVFGFFISGPNPGGGTYNNKNIAIIPGTTLPVTIDNVNASTYSQYYVDNTSGATVQYDGFTTVLTAWCKVTPCQSYTIKIAVGDAGDSAYDSAVFLEENSFSTNAVNVSTSYTAVGTVDTAAIRGCSDATVTFSTSANVTQPMVINYTIGGTAVNGVDYQQIASSVTIPVGSSSASVNIVPIFTGQPGPTVTVTITAQTSICSGTSVTTVYILNNELMTTQFISNDTMLCGGSADLLIAVSGGMPPYSYSWDNGLATTPNYTVTPTQTTTYIVGVSDACTQTLTEDVVVSVGSGYGSISNDTLICQGGTATLVATGGTSYLWSNGMTGASINVSPTQATDYFVTISGACDGWDTVHVDVNPLPVVTAKPPTQSICMGEGVSLVAGGGTSYQWAASPGDPSLGNQNTNQAIDVAPVSSVTYTVTATDDMGCVNTARATVTINPQPVADFFATPKIVNILEPFITFFDNSSGAVTWQWDLGDGTTSSSPSFEHIYNDTGTFEINLVVKNQFGCTDSTSGYIMVRPNYTFYVPSAFTPNNDLKNDFFYAFGEGVIEYEMRIFNRWGELVFLCDDINMAWDGKVNGNEAPVGVYFYKINYTNGFNKKKMVSGSVTLLR